MDDLVPVFVPPLATLLAAAQRSARRRLTRDEVERIRDAGTCIATRAEDAAGMIASRGYRDVDPENVWADWHRLRVELTGDGCLPKIVMCVLGDAGFGARASELLRARGVEHEVHGRDIRMPRAFAASSIGAHPSLGEADVAAIAAHGSVVYALGRNATERDAAPEAARLLALCATLFDAGAVAAKCESSGIAHGRARWLELASVAAAGGDDTRFALFDAYVQYPIGADGGVYTCGMHLLGLPDVITAAQPESLRALGVFAAYFAAECAPGAFREGHTFRVDADAPRFRAAWEPCTGYEEDDFFFNPFGRYRLVPV